MPSDVKTGNRVKATEEFLKHCERDPSAYQGLGLVLQKKGPECYVQFDSKIGKHWMHSVDLEVIPDDKVRLEIVLGPLAPPLRKQLPAHVSDDTVYDLQADSNAITRLSGRGLITPTAHRQARDRLARKIQQVLDAADEKLIKGDLPQHVCESCGQVKTALKFCSDCSDQLSNESDHQG